MATVLGPVKAAGRPLGTLLASVPRYGVGYAVVNTKWASSTGIPGKRPLSEAQWLEITRVRRKRDSLRVHAQLYVGGKAQGEEAFVREDVLSPTWQLIAPEVFY